MSTHQTDWQTIEESVIYGYINDEGNRIFPNLKEASEKYEVSYNTLRRRASKGQWLQKKEAYATKVTNKVTEKKSEYDANNIVLSDDKFMATGEKLRKLVDLNLEKDLKYVQDEDGFIKAYHMKMYGDALRSAQEVVKVAQGELTDRVGVEQSGNVKVDITDPDFMSAELDFMNKLIEK